MEYEVVYSMGCRVSSVDALAGVYKWHHALHHSAAAWLKLRSTPRLPAADYRREDARRRRGVDNLDRCGVSPSRATLWSDAWN